MNPTPILAHGGGWDELLITFVPILLILVVMRFAGRRGERGDDQREVPPDWREVRRRAVEGETGEAPGEGSPSDESSGEDEE